MEARVFESREERGEREKKRVRDNLTILPYFTYSPHLIIVLVAGASGSIIFFFSFLKVCAKR